VRAPAADIFDAWTDPAAMAQWMTPTGTAAAEVIQPPEVLVFTWRSEFTGMRDTLVTVRLTERGSHETEIEITHELATDGQASSHVGGWSQLLGRLQAHVESP
jgi:uncharacterized protein YndB with AHSA1/START domain